jgi:hypothetical protein
MFGYPCLAGSSLRLRFTRVEVVAAIKQQLEDKSNAASRYAYSDRICAEQRQVLAMIADRVATSALPEIDLSLEDAYFLGLHKNYPA